MQKEQRERERKREGKTERDRDVGRDNYLNSVFICYTLFMQKFNKIGNTPVGMAGAPAPAI